MYAKRFVFSHLIHLLKNPGSFFNQIQFTLSLSRSLSLSLIRYDMIRSLSLYVYLFLSVSLPLPLCLYFYLGLIRFPSPFLRLVSISNISNSIGKKFIYFFITILSENKYVEYIYLYIYV